MLYFLKLGIDVRKGKVFFGSHCEFAPGQSSTNEVGNADYAELCLLSLVSAVGQPTSTLGLT